MGARQSKKQGFPTQLCEPGFLGDVLLPMRGALLDHQPVASTSQVSDCQQIAPGVSFSSLNFFSPLIQPLEIKFVGAFLCPQAVIALQGVAKPWDLILFLTAPAKQ